MELDVSTLNRDVERETLTLKRIEAELRKVIVGQDYLLDRLLVGLLARGHVLIEGVPGLAKTLAVKTLAQTLHVDTQRIQFTPDLLADEINRAPAKVQSALLESMEERQVTLGDRTWPLPEPFMVLATQNPIEQEGTYPLAEAQIDRFMMKLRVNYPSRSEESEILDRMLVDHGLKAAPVVDREHLLSLRAVVDQVYLDAKMKGYILDLVMATRDPRAAGMRELVDLIAFGASPRATLFLARAAKAMALVRGRGYVIPEDVKELAADVLRHRIILTYEAEAEEVTSDAVVAKLLDRIRVP